MTEKALEKKPLGAVSLPEFLHDYANTGLDHIQREDLQLPRLALAQGLSPQLNKKKPEYIDGLSLGDVFNSETGEVLGTGPWDIAIIRADSPRYVEFIPRDDGGGVRDPNVPADDPRTEFTVDPETGDRVNPLATKFYDFLAIFLHNREMIALSFKNTGLRVARHLNTLMKMRKVKIDNDTKTLPIFMGKYRLEAIMQQNAKGDFANFKIDNAGLVEDEEILRFLAEQYEAVKEKNLVIDRDDTPDQTDEEM